MTVEPLGTLTSFPFTVQDASSSSSSAGKEDDAAALVRTQAPPARTAASVLRRLWRTDAAAEAAEDTILNFVRCGGGGAVTWGGRPSLWTSPASSASTSQASPARAHDSKWTPRCPRSLRRYWRRKPQLESGCGDPAVSRCWGCCVVVTGSGADFSPSSFLLRLSNFKSIYDQFYECRCS